MKNNTSSTTWSTVIRIFVGLTGFATGLTVLFLGMRAVLNIGGFCAEGGPYQIQVHCPEGIDALVPLGVLGMMVFGALAVISTIRQGPYLIILMWSALFISLGWNFLEFALYPPDKSGLVISWLICGVVFIIMGCGPLLLLISMVSTSKTTNGYQNSRQRTTVHSIKIILLATLHIIASTAGIGLGIWLFRFFT